MKRWLMLAAVAAMGVANSGCLLNLYPSNETDRIKVLMNQSEDLRQVEQEWMRIWMVDQPSHLTPDRVHGGIG